MGLERSRDTTRYTRSTMVASTPAGSSTDRSASTAGNSGKSLGSRVLRLNLERWHERRTELPSESKVTGASGRLFTMPAIILPETTVVPPSSTLAGIRCLRDISRSVAWNSRVPSPAVILMPVRMGRVEDAAVPLITTERAFCRAVWLTVNLITNPFFRKKNTWWYQ